VDYYSTSFAISLLTKTFLIVERQSTANHRFSLIFGLQLRMKYSSDASFVQQPFISTTTTRYLANFINLSPNIVDLWPSEDGDGCDAVPLKYRRATPVLIHERWLSYWSIVAKLPLRSSVCFNFCSVVISCGLICIALPTCCIV